MHVLRGYTSPDVSHPPVTWITLESIGWGARKKTWAQQFARPELEQLQATRTKTFENLPVVYFWRELLKLTMLKVQKLDPGAITPTVANAGEDLGFDIYALEDTLLPPHTPIKVRTGIAVHFEKPESPQEKFGLLVRDRSSMASKGIIASGGVIDAGYRGELLVLLTSYSNGSSFNIKAGDKIAQLIPLPVLTGAGVVEANDLPASSRGHGGFGSTGK